MRFYSIMVAVYSFLITAAICWWRYSLRHPSVIQSSSSSQMRMTAGHVALISSRQLRRRLLVEHGILITIWLGWLEATMRSLDFVIWNANGTRNNSVDYLVLVPDVSKHVLTRTLLVMIGLGWGIVSPSASVSTVSMPQHYLRLVILGAVFFALTAASKIIIFKVSAKLQEFDHIDDPHIQTEVMELMGIDAILSLFIMGIDVVYAIYIAATLTQTLKYLEVHHVQSRSLVRYRQLRMAVLVVVALAALYFMLIQFEVLDNKTSGGFPFIALNLMELDYFIMIASVAYLWRPTDSEVLPLLEGEEEDEGDDDGHHVLELRGTDVEANRSMAAYSAVDQNDLELTEDVPIKVGVAT